MTGIYCIRNLINGHLYIGSAAMGFKERWHCHRHDLRTGRHHNAHLQAAWYFYGESSFRFSALEECPPEKCVEREQYFIDIFDPEYNICRVAGSSLGMKHSIEAKAKIGAASRLRTMSLAARAKISAALRGRPGRIPSLETRHKISMAKRGYIHSEVARLKMSLARRGRPFSAQHKAALSIARKGLHHSPATLLKMSAAQKRRFSFTSTINKI